MTVMTVSASLMSCRVVDRLFNGDVIARVGSDVLYEHQVLELLPKGSSPEDSAHFVKQYIDSWATQRLVLRQAEKNLSKEDRNITKELDELKRDLLSYRYEMKYVDTHLDTVITEAECESYYSDNSGGFMADTYIFKGRFVRIPSSSPSFERVERLVKSDDQEELSELDDICYNAADKYFRSDEKWVSLVTVAPLMDETLSWCEEELSESNSISLHKGGYIYMLYATEKVSPGEPVPFEYCREHIRDVLLGKRKQELVANLERNLLVDAKSSGSLTVYSKD